MGQIMNNKNYDLHPVTQILWEADEAFDGWNQVARRLAVLMQGKQTLVCDLYPGVDKNEVLRLVGELAPVLVLDTDRCKLTDSQLYEQFRFNITEDRVFGKMSSAVLGNCWDVKKSEDLRREAVEASTGLKVIVGVGASSFFRGDLLIYFDMPRWEIQLRLRNGMPNWMFDNGTAPNLTKNKIGFFLEWRMADRHKMEIFEEIDCFIDTTIPGSPKLASGSAIREGLRQVSVRPFRLQPYFDPGVWGGQWMKETFALPEEENYAWSFDGVPEENSLNLRFGQVTLEFPAINLVLRHPQPLLGQRVYQRFGAEFPIRFDLLDTMRGGNLSLQVHPLKGYIQEQFNMAYTQDESYYILDAEPEAEVYLGLREGIEPEEMLEDLRRAENGNYRFRDEVFINRFPAKKHDHFSIPAGTVHCAGSGGMVLEISATPYIFTFKLWDWDRLGLDGLPRPVHIDHGQQVIQWERDTAWVEENLMNQTKVIDQGKGWKQERTGLHSLEFIETQRYWISDFAVLECEDSVNVLNLVEGAEAVVESMDGQFEPFVVHYAETFIVPAAVGCYIIRPGKGVTHKGIAVLKAFVR